MSASVNKEKAFRDIFKKYKRKDLPLDLKDVINFNEPNEKVKYEKLGCSIATEKFEWENQFGVYHPSEWEIYHILNRPGLIFIKNSFKPIGQRYLIIRCLEYFTRKPNKLNIDIHNLIDCKEDWWEFCQRERDSKEGRSVLEKLRWATMGYHHNWDTKQYSEDSKNEFPSDLQALCSYIAEVLGFSNFQAEAAIVNFYHADSSLSGHTDHSEANVDAPLFSFSFGQSAIFLIGGKTLENEPTPILLESGDIVVMSKESRLSYHGVPRILPNVKKPWGLKEGEKLSSDFLNEEVVVKLNNEEKWKPFEDYVCKSRINLNVRQVLLPGQRFLNESCVNTNQEFGA